MSAWLSAQRRRGGGREPGRKSGGGLVGAWLGSVGVWLGSLGRGNPAVPGSVTRVDGGTGRAEGTARELSRGVSMEHGAWRCS